jgi:plasmid stabilization system protein ParE
MQTVSGPRAATLLHGGLRADRPFRGAVMAELRAALDLLVREPGIGSKVELPRADLVRRLYLGRIRYFLYYRVRGSTFEVVAFSHERRGRDPVV